MATLAASDAIPGNVAALLRACLVESQQPIALYDPADMLVWANPAFEARFLRGIRLPVSFADVIRHGFHGRFGVLIGSGDVERFLADVMKRRRSLPFRAFEVDTVDGEWFWMTEVLADGWLLSIATCITALKTNERVLREEHQGAVRAAQVDPLTGISNRQHILRLGEDLLAESRALSQAMSVVVADIDHFKQINDRFGHHVGDETLVSFCTLLQQNLRERDCVGRIGGEEFLLLLPGTTIENGCRVLDRLREKSASLTIDNDVRVTFSAGIAEVRSGETLAIALKRADAGLYAAKHGGRNRYAIASDEAPPSVPRSVRGS
jgi:diguanylate cyclase (GGDEF)-like protein